MNMKKSLPLILTAAMAFSMYSTAALGANSSKSSADFTDLQNLDAASKAKFDALISAGVFEGVADHTFGLKDKMNRAQFAKVAALIFGLPVDTSRQSSSFNDVFANDPANGYALPYIEALKQAGLTDGYGLNSFNPAGEVTKEQLAAFLIRGLNKDAEAKAAQAVSDPTVSDWAKGYAALAAQLKLMDSVGGTFGGTASATRELLVMASYQAKQQYIPGSRPSNPSSGAVQLSAPDLPTYTLSSNTKAQVKGVLQEKLTNGWRFGADIKITNTSGSTIRVPDYELRVKASDGSAFTLKASADNPRSIDAHSSVQLNYMTEIDKNTAFNLTDLLWIDVDQEVYPQKETLLADAPIGSMVWTGLDATVKDSALIGNWGVTFTVPGETSALKYTAINLSKQFTGQSPTYIVQLKVINPGSYAEVVPDFTLSGKAAGSSFVGKRIETSPITLNPGEQKYINYAITTEPDTQLTAFYILSAHSFLKQGTTVPLRYYTGRIGFSVPDQVETGASLRPYQMGDPLVIDSLSKAVNPQTLVTLQDFDWFENDGQSYKTAIAKIKFTNKSDSAIPVPQLGAQIVSAKGVAYNGVQNASSVNEVLPGMGAVGTYAFIVPKSEQANQFTFRLMELQDQQATQTQVSYKTPIAQANVAIHGFTAIGNVFTFYPYELKMDSNNVMNYSNKNMVTNSYVWSFKLETGLTIQTTDEVLADPSNPKLLFQLEGPDGKRLGSKVYSLAGENRLLSGNQSVMFDTTSDTLESPVLLKVYEVISTPYGEARRLLTTIEDK
jgi:hypothetical protein